MHISVDDRDQYAVLHLRGEFDTYYCPKLQEEVEELAKAGTTRVVLNMRLVKFINSTALGAIIKANKSLEAKGGGLAVARPSSFVRTILEKVGLNRVVGIHDSDEAAGAALTKGAAAKGAAATGDPVFEEDESAIMFGLTDVERVDHFVPQTGATNPVHGHAFGTNWRGVGRMGSLDPEGVAFTWNGGTTGLTPFEMGQLLALGTELTLKFRLPLLKKGHLEALAVVSSLEERPDGVRVTARFSEELDSKTRQHVEQYAKDMAFLKQELRKATGE
ncbi:MAG: STAS domain-containing protein [Planctomycetota bacterium]